MVEVRLTPDQEAFIRHGIEDGRFRDEREAVDQALLLWEERERYRAETLAAVDHADASLAAGHGYVLNEESIGSLADQIKRQGRARIAAENTQPH